MSDQLRDNHEARSRTLPDSKQPVRAGTTNRRLATIMLKSPCKRQVAGPAPAGGHQSRRWVDRLRGRVPLRSLAGTSVNTAGVLGAGHSVRAQVAGASGFLRDEEIDVCGVRGACIPCIPCISRA